MNGKGGADHMSPGRRFVPLGHTYYCEPRFQAVESAPQKEGVFLKRVFAHVLPHALAAIAVLFAMLVLSAASVLAFASPNPHPNPGNQGNHYGWYKHPASVPTPSPTPQPTSQPSTQPAPQSHPSTSTPASTHAGQDPATLESTGPQATPAAIVLPGQTSIIVVDVKTDDLALWVIYMLLAALAVLWIGLVGAATVRSMTGRPAPKRA